MLTKPPLSPENNGTNVSNVWFLRSVLSELFNIPPATVPNMEQKNRTGVDCLTICLTSLSAVYPEINETTVIKIMIANNTILTIGSKPIRFTIKTLKMIAGNVKKSPTAAMKGVVMLSGSQPPSKLLSEMNMVIGSMIIVDINPAMNEIKTKSKRLMLGKLNIIQITFAIAPSKTERTIVKIMEAVMFSSKRSDLLNSGDIVPMWR